MSVESFVDSNVVLYTASKDPADAAKSAIAARLMTETRFGISLQVVQEFYHNARIKARLGITNEQSERVVGLLLQRPLVITDVELFNEARRLAERFQLRYWSTEYSNPWCNSGREWRDQAGIWNRGIERGQLCVMGSRQLPEMSIGRLRRCLTPSRKLSGRQIIRHEQVTIPE